MTLKSVTRESVTRESVTQESVAHEPVPQEPGTRTAVRRVVPVLGALVVAGALAACSGGQPGAAAVVGDRVISTADVETATRELNAVFGDASLSSTSVVIALVQAPVVDEVAAEAGVAVSEETARDTLAAAAEDAGVRTDGFSDAAVTVMQLSLAGQALATVPDAEQAQAAVAGSLAEQDLRLNPRFGTVSDEGAFTATTYPWLVAAPAPAP